MILRKYHKIKINVSAERTDLPRTPFSQVISTDSKARGILVFLFVALN